MFLTSFVFVVTSLVPSLASETLFSDTNYGCDNTGMSTSNPCFPRLSVDPEVARVLEGILGFTAIILLFIAKMLYTRSTGVYSDPSTIATVASLLHHPDVVEDFRKFNSEATSEEIKSALSSKRYSLGLYTTEPEIVRYGILPLQLDSMSTSSQSYSQSESYTAVDNPAVGPDQRNGWKLSSLLTDMAFCLFILGLLGVVIAYYIVKGNSGFNNFFNSETFGPRFLMTAAATIMATQWKRIERQCHTLSPYAQLYQGNAHPAHTILLPKSTLPITSIIPMLRHRYPFVTFIAFIAFLSEIAVIAIVGIPLHAAQTKIEFQLCSYISIGILGLMTLALVALMFWRRRLPHLPRAPDTLAGVCSYLCASHMVGDFEGLEWEERKERDRKIIGLRKKYEYRKGRAVDGVVRWKIDETDSK